MDELISILKLTEQELKIVVYNYLINKNMKTICEDGFVYAKGEIPILLVAHLDTVFDMFEKQICYDEIEDKLFSVHVGLGGDDRCGVYAIMEILKQYKPYVLFTEGEEKGGIGAKKAIQKLGKPDVKYIIEFDRRGSNDCVFYDCGNEQFINYIESFGFIKTEGIFSDISILGVEWDIAAVNLSSGYYNEHTKSEYIKYNELLNNILRVSKMLELHQDVKYFDYQEIQYLESADKKYYSNLFSEEYELLWKIFDYPINKKTRSIKRNRK